MIYIIYIRQIATNLNKFCKIDSKRAEILCHIYILHLSGHPSKTSDQKLTFWTPPCPTLSVLKIPQSTLVHPPLPPFYRTYLMNDPLVAMELFQYLARNILYRIYFSLSPQILLPYVFKAKHFSKTKGKPMALKTRGLIHEENLQQFLS